MSTKVTKVEDLKGFTFSSVSGLEVDSQDIVLTSTCGRKFMLYHEQDCCEYVDISDVCGDVSDLINAEVLHFECREDSEVMNTEYGDSQTWTFYDIQTTKGCVNIRWVGVSNGYYSESVDFKELKG